MSENKRESLQKKMAVTKPVDLVVLAEYEKDDDNLEYVMLPKDITRRLYSDTIELTIERTGEVVRIQKNQIQVGSHSDCDLRLNDMKYHTSVARRQATFYYENNTWFLRDDTVNVSWINDIRMEKGKKYELYGNDVINFAQAEKITFFKKKENTASEDKLIGTIILHRYRVEKKISITQIYLVWDLAFNVFRIMRIYKKTYDSGSMQMSHRDLDEIFVLMKLNHHAIPKIIDFNEDNEHVLVIREYDEGNSLRKIVKEEGLQPVERIIDWISQICDVLSYLHSQSFILCEVEPGNIILMPDGRLKLSSFSTLTRAERNSEEETRVLFTPLLGEPGYAAPELYETCLPLTPQTDIYGIGAVMHYLLVGKSSASTPFNYPKMKQCCEPLWKNFSKNERKKIENLEDIIDKCVAFDVKDRYKSCAELLKDLNCLQGKPRKSIFGRLFD